MYGEKRALHALFFYSSFVKRFVYKALIRASHGKDCLPMAFFMHMVSETASNRRLQ